MSTKNRNRKIKELWFKDHWSQYEIADLYEITQSRVSAIIYDKRPKYKYCATCNKRVGPTLHVCSKCKKSNRKKLLANNREKRMVRRKFTEDQRIAREEYKKIKRVRYVFLKVLRLILKKKVKYERDQSPFFDCPTCDKKYQKSKATRSYCPDCSGHLSRFEGRDKTRELRRMLDKHTCQLCGYVGYKGDRNLDTQMRDGGILALRYIATKDVDLIMTLCHECNTNVDKKR